MERDDSVEVKTEDQERMVVVVEVAICLRKMCK